MGHKPVTLDPHRTCVRCELPLIDGWCAATVPLSEADYWERLPGGYLPDVHISCEAAAAAIARAYIAGSPVEFARPARRSIAWAKARAFDVLLCSARHHPGRATLELLANLPNDLFDARLTHGDRLELARDAIAQAHEERAENT